MSFKKNARSFVFWIVVILLLTSFLNLYYGGGQKAVRRLPYSEFSKLVDDDQVKEIVLQGYHVSGQLKDGAPFTTYLPMQDFGIVTQLKKHDIKIESLPLEGSPVFNFILSSIPMLLLIGVWFFLFRQMQGGGGKGFSFGKSKAKLNQTPTVTFQDVAGADEAKESLEEIVDFLKSPGKYQKIGGRIPRGVLLVGPPGTGKTLLARAVAGEAKASFFSVSGSDFVEMFVGVGASRVRDMFAKAREKHPAIIFIDEIDALARKRGGVGHGGHDEREQTLNQLLVEMDGFDTRDGVIIIAATNRADVLDPAILRPGRFDRQVTVDLPNIIGRQAILETHARKVVLEEGIDLGVVARGTPGFSGADLANLVNEAALLCVKKGRKEVTLPDLEEAKDKVMMGPERRSFLMTEEEKKVTAFHEAGHALVAYHSPCSDPIHKITIVPRGHALGMVVRLPENDRTSVSLEKIQADLAVALAGRVSEELVFGPPRVTTGAASDFRMASHYARKMVLEWGMSSLGLIYLEEGDMLGTRRFSEEVAKKVDDEIGKILRSAQHNAKNILESHRDQLDLLAKTVQERETLTGDQVRVLLTTGSLPPIESLPEDPQGGGAPSQGGQEDKCQESGGENVARPDSGPEGEVPCLK